MNSGACLHLLCGKAGAGKSTLAAALAAEHKAILIAEDIWLVRLYGPMKSFDDYAMHSQRAKTVVGPLVVDLLRLGQTVVLDYPANTRRSRLWFRSLVDSANVPHVLHHLTTPDEICLKRIGKRNIERPEGSYHLTKADFDHGSSFFEPPQKERASRSRYMLRRTPEQGHSHQPRQVVAVAFATCTARTTRCLQQSTRRCSSR